MANNLPPKERYRVTYADGRVKEFEAYSDSAAMMHVMPPNGVPLDGPIVLERLTANDWRTRYIDIDAGRELPRVWRIEQEKPGLIRTTDLSPQRKPLWFSDSQERE